MPNTSPPHKQSPTRVLVITLHAIPFGSVSIGILRPLIELEKDKHIQLRISHNHFYKKYNYHLIAWSDVVIFCRNNYAIDLEHLYLCKKLHKKVIYEIDDNFFDISLNTLVGRHLRHFFNLHVVKRFFQLSDLTRVYSKQIEKHAERYQANIAYGKLYFDHDLIKNHHRRSSASGKIKIVYPTLRTDEPLLKIMLYDALKMVLDQYHQQVELHLWGQPIPSVLQHLDNVIFHEPIICYEDFIKAFASMQFDIGLAPLMVNDVFFWSKTNNKYREYGACSIAGIYSQSLPYIDCIRHEENGFFAEPTTQGWADAISRLIESPELRQRIVKTALADIQQNYTLKQASDVFYQHIHTVLHAPAITEQPVSISDFTKTVEIYYQTTSKNEKKLVSLINNVIALLQGNCRQFNINTDHELFIHYSQQHINNLKICLIRDETMIDIISTLFHVNAMLVCDITSYHGNTEILRAFLLQYKPRVVMHTDSPLKLFLDESSVSYSLIKQQHTFTDVYNVEGFYSIYLEIIDHYFYQGYLTIPLPKHNFKIYLMRIAYNRLFILFYPVHFVLKHYRKIRDTILAKRSQWKILKFHLKWRLFGFRKL